MRRGMSLGFVKRKVSDIVTVAVTLLFWFE